MILLVTLFAKVRFPAALMALAVVEAERFNVALVGRFKLLTGNAVPLAAFKVKNALLTIISPAGDGSVAAVVKLKVPAATIVAPV